MTPEQAGVTTGQVMAALALVGLFVAVVGVGLRMSGYQNPALGVSLIWVGVAGIAGTVVWWRWPLAGWEWVVVVGALLLVLLVAWWRRSRPQGPWGPSVEVDVATVRHLDVLLAEFAGVRGGRIEHKAFEHCRIIGPGVISLHGTKLAECEVDPPPDHAIWASPSPSPAGVVPVIECRFYRCSFEEIGFLVPAEEVEGLREALMPPVGPSPTTDD